MSEIAPTVGVVVVAYQTVEPIRTCLESLTANGGPHLGNVVVVDNASTDGTIDMLAADFPGVEVIPLPENLGFAAGCNRGAAVLDTDYLLFLNPDAAIWPGTLKALIDAAGRNPDAGQIGGRTIDEHGHLDPSSCWGAPSLWSALMFATGLSAVFSGNAFLDPESLGRWPRDTERDVGVVTGCLLLMSTDIFKSVGGFDETYFLYGEDADLSMRVRLAGYRTIVTPEATITHLVGAASNNSVERSTLVLKGRMTLYRCRFGPLKGRAMKLLYLIGVSVRAALPVRQSGTGSLRHAPWRELYKRRKLWWPGYPS